MGRNTAHTNGFGQLDICENIGCTDSNIIIVAVAVVVTTIIIVAVVAIVVTVVAAVAVITIVAVVGVTVISAATFVYMYLLTCHINS